MSTEWQPIETAPKDGTRILAIVAGRHPDTGEPFIPDVVEWDGGRWFSENWWDDNALYSPTHWMPLPNPPKQEA